MSVAFTKEDSAETASETMLPDRPVSPHPNLVTAEGLRALQQLLDEARHAYDAASSVDDVNERRRQQAAPFRDIRYYAERIRTAQIVEPSGAVEAVAFGTRVTFEREDGRVQTYRIVGEDEAEPANGSISFVSPIARALIGRRVGDLASLGDTELKVVAIS